LTASESDHYDPRNVAKTAEKRGSASFGETLKRERELRKIPLREVAEATKINIRYLEALERSDFSDLPSGAFTRGFIKAYAHHIGLDEGETINAYLYELARQDEEEKVTTPESLGAALGDSIGERFREQAAAGERRKRRVRIAVVVAGLLLVAVVVAVTILFVLHQTKQVSEDDRRPAEIFGIRSPS
jgi:cytoskeletal protein RodZ